MMDNKLANEASLFILTFAFSKVSFPYKDEEVYLQIKINYLYREMLASPL